MLHVLPECILDIGPNWFIMWFFNKAVAHTEV